MKTLYLSIILGIIILFSIPSVIAQSEPSEIPSWVKKNMVFWGDGLLEDNEMVNILQWLVDTNIIQLGENIVVDNTMSDPFGVEKYDTTLQEKHDEMVEYLDKQRLDEKEKYQEHIKINNENVELLEKELSDLSNNNDKYIEEKEQEHAKKLNEEQKRYEELINNHSKLLSEYKRLYIIYDMKNSTNPDDFK